MKQFGATAGPTVNSMGMMNHMLGENASDEQIQEQQFDEAEMDGDNLEDEDDFFNQDDRDMTDFNY